MLRAAADASGADAAASWLSWLSPIGWARRMRPYAGERWGILALPVVVVLAAMAVALAARRDVGAGIPSPRLGPATASPSLRSPLALGWQAPQETDARVGRRVRPAQRRAQRLGEECGTLFTSTPQVGRMFTLIGAGSNPSDVFLSAIMGMFGLLAAAYAVEATLRLRTEEAGSLIEPLLVT